MKGVTNSLNIFFAIGFLIFFSLVSFNLSYGQEEPTIKTLLTTGIEKINSQEYEESISYFDRVLKTEPQNVNALINKGFALLNLEEYEEAISYFNEVLEIEPHNLSALSKKGAALLKLERDEEATVFFDKVLEIEPDNIGTLSNQGVILAKLERYEEAVTYFDRVLEINPDDFGALRNKGLALLKLERQDEAISSLDRILQIELTDTSTLADEIDLIKKIGMSTTKNSKYYAYVQITVRNSLGNLVGFVESDNSDYLPLSLTDKFLDNYSIKGTMIRDGKLFEFREIITTHVDLKENHAFAGKTELTDPRPEADIVYFSALGHGYPMEIGDSIKISWNIMRLIEN